MDLVKERRREGGAGNHQPCRSTTHAGGGRRALDEGSATKCEHRGKKKTIDYGGAVLAMFGVRRAGSRVREIRYVKFWRRAEEKARWRLSTVKGTQAGSHVPQPHMHNMFREVARSDGTGRGRLMELRTAFHALSRGG